MSWKSKLPEFREKHAKARDAALLASAQVYANAVKRGLRGGYTSGAFFTGEAMNSVAVHGPVTRDGVRMAIVGTPLMYPLFWELGHMNLFTRKYERKEVWMPAGAETRQERAETFKRVYQSRMPRGKH